MAEQPLTIDFPAPTSEDLTSLEEAHFKAAEAKAYQESTFWAYREVLDILGLYQERYQTYTRSRELRVGKRAINIIERIAPERSFRKRLFAYFLRKLLAANRRKIQLREETTNLPSFPPVDSPQVTIIIPVYNKWHITAQCLRSLKEHLPATPLEIIVVDDASTDRTREYLPRIEGIKLVQHEKNQGYILSVNDGLKAAGDSTYILLLNNDTILTDGWCDTLVATADADPAIGIVGSKLLSADGILQEAGGALWNDGTGFSFGRCDDPKDRMYNFLRDAHYCSAASLLVRKVILDTLGGLDTQFVPAYYDDSDLAFSARKMGYRVVYQPDSVVTHIEGVSHGTDISKGIKKYQEINRHKFVKKWQEELEKFHNAPGSASPRIASWSAPKGHILVADHCIPTPDQDSGSVRITEILKLFVHQGYRVTFAPAIQYHDNAYEHTLQQMGVNVLPASQDRERFLKELGEELVMAFLSRPNPAAGYIDFIRRHCPNAKILYDTVDLHHIRLKRQATVEEDESVHREARHMFFVELACSNKTDATIVVSEEERAVLTSYGIDKPIFVIPNIHTVDLNSPGFADREGLLFVGNYNHPPNVDAALWLANEIMPRVWKKNPRVTLTLVGSNCPSKVRQLSAERPQINVVGWVQDLHELHSTHRFSVAPLRFGAGVKGKIGDSISRGLPTITTHYGAEGMKLVDGYDAVIVDSLSPEEFASRILGVYDDAEAWQQLSSHGIRKIQEEFSPDAVSVKFRDMFDELKLSHPWEPPI